KGRTFPVTLNTCVLRVTPSHVPLLRRWQALLEDARYTAAQSMPLGTRAAHLMSDQDVLNALIGAHEFEGVPVRYLRGGRDVIHCGGSLGHALGRRIAGLFHPIPPFLHAVAGKPWWVFSPAYEEAHPIWFTFSRRLLQEVSPYVVAARRVRGEV